jgi:diphosphomevalonate decarboxylase
MMLVAATEAGEKAVGSTGGMLHTQDTSPYYASWARTAPDTFTELRQALLAGDLARMGEAMEHSALCMHASMFAARPALVYWTPATLALIARVRELRRAGSFAYFTIDAGPHVKVLTRTDEAPALRAALEAVPGVRRVITSGIGQGARLLGVT